MMESMSDSFGESGESRGEPRGLRLIAVLLALTAAYFVAGKLGLALAFVHANATAIWPPTGIALAAGLLFGLRVWPAILVGAFLVNFTTPGTTVATSLGIAAGNTVEAVVGTWLVQTFAGGASAFRRPDGVFRFAVLAACVATTLSASIGVVSLWLGGLAETARIADIWLTWWLGDAVGAVLLAPFLVVWARPTGQAYPNRSWLEAMALVAVMAGIGWVVVPRHPYYAITDSEGRFRLDDVPPGEYTLVAWHEPVALSGDSGKETAGLNRGSPVEVRTKIKVSAGQVTMTNVDLK